MRDRRGRNQEDLGALGAGGVSCRPGWDAVDEGLGSWVGGPSVLCKGRFDVTINLVCKGGMKAVGGFFRIIAPDVSVGDVGNLEGNCICCGATVLVFTQCNIIP